MIVEGERFKVETSNQPTKTENLSIRNKNDVARAAHIMQEGKVIGTENYGVCALWGDGLSIDQNLNPLAASEVLRIKGEKRHGKPFAGAMPTEDVLPWVNLDQIPDEVRDLFIGSGRELVQRVASLGFLRLPIRQDIAQQLPDYMTSIREDGVPFFQFWDPRGIATTRTMIEEAKKGFRTIKIAGKDVSMPFVTSMNVSGQPEITDLEEGKRFCQEHGVQAFLTDEMAPILSGKGSYTIVELAKPPADQPSRPAVTITRDGAIPGHMFAQLLGVNHVDLSHAKKPLPQNPQHTIPESFYAFPAHQLRLAILAFLHNIPEENILDHFLQ